MGNPTPPSAGYPDLAAFVGGWLHQDFDLAGETLEEVVDAFAQSSDCYERHRIRADIARFLQTADDTLDQHFEAVFRPDVEPTAFAADTRAFLEKLSLLLDHAGGC